MHYHKQSWSQTNEPAEMRESLDDLAYTENRGEEGPR